MQYAQSDKTVKHKNGVGSQFVIDDLYKNADRDNYELPPPKQNAISRGAGRTLAYSDFLFKNILKKLRILWESEEYHLSGGI